VNDVQPKLLMLMYGVIAFFAVLGLLLLVVDRAPKRGREKVQLVAFLGPALVLLAVGLLIPAVRTVLLSFKDPFSVEWVGFDNYAWMFTDRGSRRILLNTAAWVLLVPALATTVGLLYAIVIDKAKGEAFAKALVFMPMAISLVGASIIWKLVYAVRPEGRPQIGLANQLLVAVGLEPYRFLQDPPWNTAFLIVIMIWIQAGFAMVILSRPSRRSRPTSSRPARLDGVNAWQMFRNVTLPSIRPGRGGRHGDDLHRDAEGLRHRPHHHRRPVRHRRGGHRAVRPGLPVRRGGQGLCPRCAAVRARPADRHLPGERPALAEGGPVTTAAAPVRVPVGRGGRHAGPDRR
jgi:alpha-glucoside transport system permease protein